MKFSVPVLLVALVLGFTLVASAADVPASLQFAGLQWTPAVDSWQVTNGGLINGAMDSSNTNVYAPLSQPGNVLTYTYTIRFVDTASTGGPMAGMHLLADNPTDANRGNSILVWQEKAMMRVYQAVNGSWNAKQRFDIPSVPVAPGETHTYRIVVDLKANQISVYRDEVSLGQWTAPLPLPVGGFVSARTSKTLAEFQSFGFNAQ